MRIRIRLGSVFVMLVALLASAVAAAPAQAQPPTIPATPGPTPAPSSSATPGPPPAPVLGCAADFQVTNTWSTGFVAELVATNTGTVAVTWEVTLTFDSGSTVVQGWNGGFTVNGNEVVIEPAVWHQVLAPGTSSAVVGMTGTGSGTLTGIEINCQ